MAFVRTALPVWVFAEMVIIQILLSRYVFRQSLLKTVIASFSIGLSILLVQEYLYFRSFGASMAPMDILGYVLLHGMTYTAFAYCYMHFINLGETARRIRLMRELYEATEGLSREQILAHYNADIILGNRLGRLLSSRQIRFDGERYYLQGRFMIFTAQCMVALKKFLLGKSSEYD